MLICVTGIKGSGKTTTMNIIKKNGFDIFIMDRWIHQIYKTNNIGFILIKDNFGNKYIGKNGVNRKKLGKLVFSNSLQLAKLNKIMIPIMQQKLSELLSENKLIFVELAIYLYHVNKFKKYFHKIIHIWKENNGEKNDFFKKKIGIKKYPTFYVGKCETMDFYKQSHCCFLVDNSQNKKYLEKQILFFLKNFLKKI